MDENKSKETQKNLWVNVSPVGNTSGGAGKLENVWLDERKRSGRGLSQTLMDR